MARRGRTLLVVAISLVVASAAPAAFTARPILHVQARIRVDRNPNSPNVDALANRKVTFVPATINVGTVIIEIQNLDEEPHYVEINGVRSRKLLKGSRASLRVTFKRPGQYPMAVSSDTPIVVSGALKVIK